MTNIISITTILLPYRWYKLESKDHNDPSKVTPMGSICYSIQIWPKDMAVAQPVGAARNEPNTNPFLPPPVGRFKFSWSAIYSFAINRYFSHKYEYLQMEMNNNLWRR